MTINDLRRNSLIGRFGVQYADSHFKEFAHLNFPDKREYYLNFINSHEMEFEKLESLRRFFSERQQQNDYIKKTIVDHLKINEQLTTGELSTLTGIDKSKITRITKELVRSGNLYQTNIFINSQCHYLYSLTPFDKPVKSRKYEIGTIVIILRDHDKTMKNKVGTIIGYADNKIIVNVNGNHLKKHNSAIKLI